METVELLLKKANNCLALDKRDKALRYYNLVLEEDISNAEAWYGRAELDYGEYVQRKELSYLELAPANNDSDYLKNIKQSLSKIEYDALHSDINHRLVYLENYIKNTDSIQHNIIDMIKELSEIYYFQKAFINTKKIQVITNEEVAFYLRILSILENAYKKDESNINLVEAIIDILVDKLSGVRKNLYKECNPRVRVVGYENIYRDTVYLIIDTDIFFLSQKDEVLFTNKLNKYSELLSALNPNFTKPNIKRKNRQILDNSPCPKGDTATLGEIFWFIVAFLVLLLYYNEKLLDFLD